MSWQNNGYHKRVRDDCPRVEIKDYSKEES